MSRCMENKKRRRCNSVMRVGKGAGASAVGRVRSSSSTSQKSRGHRGPPPPHSSLMAGWSSQGCVKAAPRLAGSRTAARISSYSAHTARQAASASVACRASLSSAATAAAYGARHHRRWHRTTPLQSPPPHTHQKHLERPRWRRLPARLPRAAAAHLRGRRPAPPRRRAQGRR